MKKKSLSVPVKPTRKELPPRKEKDLEFPEEISEAGSGSQVGSSGGKKSAASNKSKQKDVLPWEQPWVREDVKKMLPVYFTEPVYLKLKFISENSRVSMNEFIREAVIDRLDEEVAELKKSM